MPAIRLIKLIIDAKNKKEIRKLLNRHRMSVSKSKYC